MAIERTTITTGDGRVYYLSGMVTAVEAAGDKLRMTMDAAARASASVDEFAARMRAEAVTHSATWSGSFTFDADSETPKKLWAVFGTSPLDGQLTMGFDPAVSDEWVDTIRPLPDTRGT